MTTAPTTNLDHALAYARHGWAVLPLHRVIDGACDCPLGAQCDRGPGKHPHTQHGLSDATTAEQQILDWFAQWPDANVGVVVPEGYAVVDVDPRHGGTLGQLAPAQTPVRAKTGGDGYHLWFRIPDGVTLTGNKFETLSGIDLKLGGKGYVVVAPSVHPSGKRYEWLGDWAANIPDMPPHLVALAQAKKAPRSAAGNDDEPIPDGQRNTTLASMAGQMRRGGFDAAAIQAALAQVNAARCAPPLPESEVTAIAASVGRYAPGDRAPGGNRPVEQPTPEKQAGNERGRVGSLASLLTEDIPPMRWAVEGLIPQGLTLLAGKPKVGKSLMALGLALAVGTGGRAFGKVPCERGRALYLALEDTKRRLKSRTEMMLAHEPAPFAGDVEFALDWEPMDRGGAVRLTTYLAEHPDTRLVVIDTLQKIRPAARSRNGQDYETDYAAITTLKTIADEFGVAIVVIHHLRKATSDDPQDQVSGTTGLTGAADSTMVLSRARGEGRAELFMTGRDIEENTLVLSKQEETQTWVLTNESAETVRLPETQQGVVVLLQERGTLGAGEIAAALKMTSGATNQLLRRMLGNGTIHREGYGKYGLSPAFAARPATEAQRAWLEKEGYSGDTLTKDQADILLHALFDEKNLGRDPLGGHTSSVTHTTSTTHTTHTTSEDGEAPQASCMAIHLPHTTSEGPEARIIPGSQAQDAQDVRVVCPPHTTDIPADDKDACLVCGADTLGGGDYCATHWPKTVTRPGYIMPEATCAHHVDTYTDRQCDGCGGEWADLPDGVTTFRDGQLLTWDAHRRQWTTQTSTQAN